MVLTAIRTATDADFDAILDILYDDPAPDVRAVTRTPAQARAIGALLIRNDLEIELDRTVVAVLDGSPVGLLERSRPGAPAGGGAGSAMRVLAGGLRIVGPAGLLRYARYRSARQHVQIDRPEDAYYVGELDVHPRHRNAGIGGQLMAFAEDEARAAGYARMALSTGITNPARRLYERCGFLVVETRVDARYERLTGIPGRVLMTKALV